MNKATSLCSLAVSPHVGRNGKNFGSFGKRAFQGRTLTIAVFGGGIFYELLERLRKMRSIFKSKPVADFLY